MLHDSTLSFEIVEHNVVFCVVRGGMAGLCASITTARNGNNTILVQDRPALGGNASSEIRLYLYGARGKDNVESGILEELKLENRYRNPQQKDTLWDTVLYKKAQFQQNLKLLLNCSIHSLKTSNNRITEIQGWQLTAQLSHKIRTKFYADCSDNCVLKTSGAQFRRGREAQSEFNESLAPEMDDRKSMGSSLLMQLRKIDPKDHLSSIKPLAAMLTHGLPAKAIGHATVLNKALNFRKHVLCLIVIWQISSGCLAAIQRKATGQCASHHGQGFSV